jgi:hypothetical protein
MGRGAAPCNVYVILSGARVVPTRAPVILNEARVILTKAPVILSEAKDLPYFLCERSWIPPEQILRPWRASE